jgi:hypothetical protein
MTRGTLVYVGQRFVLIALTALVVSSIVFIGVHQLPATHSSPSGRAVPHVKPSCFTITGSTNHLRSSIWAGWEEFFGETWASPS